MRVADALIPQPAHERDVEMKFSKSLIGLALLLAVSGCASLQEACDEKVDVVHSKLTAHEAWARWSWAYDELAHPKHFARGFKAGYQDILNGGKGCQPTLPPRDYWRPCFRNSEGQCSVNAWFDGWSHGVTAARQDGAGSFGTIPLSPTARGNIANANRPVPMTDWSGAQGTTAPAPADYGTAPAATPAAVQPTTEPPVAPPLTAPEPPANNNYEEETKPILEKALDTTSRGGRVLLPTLGG